MVATREPLLSAAPFVGAPVPFVRAVWRAITWKMILAAELLALTWGMLTYLDRRGPEAPPHMLHTYLISRAVGALFILLAALAADEAVRRGSRAWSAFPVALLAGSCVGAIVQWYLRSWMGVVDFAPDAGAPFARMVFVALDVSAFGGLAMLAYLNRQSAQRMLAGVRTAELERVRVEQRLIESRLAMTQAQVDPAAVLRQLTDIRNLYDAGQPAADERLESLIQELRVSVAHSVAVSAPRESAG